MKNKPKKRGKSNCTRYSPGERRGWVNKFKNSGMSQSAFCKANGIIATTLSNWLYLRKNKKHIEKPVTFAEVDIEISPRLSVEIEYPDGKRLKLHDFQVTGAHAEFLRQVISC